MNWLLTLGRRVSALTCGVGLLILCGVSQSYAQSSKPSFWNLDEVPASSSPTLNLRKQGVVVGAVSVSHLHTLLEVRRRIQSAAGFSANFALTDMGMPNPNAFSTSNDKGTFVGVNLAMLSLLGDDADAIAAVVGHEYAHIALQHRSTRAQREGARQGISAVLGFVLGRAGVPLAGTLSDLGTTMVSHSFSRDEERDADAKGISYAAAAGYSVEGGIRAWERMAARNRSATLPFLATHPAPDERIQNMRTLAMNYPSSASPVVATAQPVPAQPTVIASSFASAPAAASLASPETTKDMDLRALQSRVIVVPSDGRAWHALARQYASLGEEDQARRAYAEAARIDPSNIDSLEELGALHAKAGEKEKVKEIWQSLFKLDHVRAERYFNAYILP